MHARRLAFLLAVAVSTGCAASKQPDLYEGIKAESVSDPKVNLKALHTFAWAVGVAAVRDPSGTWQAPDFDVPAEIEYQIETGLRDKGLVPVKANPDVYVSYVILANVEDAKLTREKSGDLVLENASVGALVVELAEPSSLKPVWRAAVMGPLHGATMPTEDRRKRVDYAVKQLFEKLPR
jgi:hypothetical protein